MKKQNPKVLTYVLSIEPPKSRSFLIVPVTSSLECGDEWDIGPKCYIKGEDLHLASLGD